MKKILILLALVVLYAQYAFANPQISELGIGMPKDSITGVTEICGKDLCGEILFGGEAWQGRYILEDDILVGIGITAKPINTYVDAAFLGLELSPYIMIYAESNANTYNFLANARAGKSEEFMEEEFAQWMLALEKSKPSYALYLYAEPEVYENLKNLPDSELAIPLEADMPDAVLTLVSITPREIRLLSGTVKMIQQRLEDIQQIGKKQQQQKVIELPQDSTQKLYPLLHESK